MADQFTAAPEAAIPLCVDLDGTLIKSDLFWESFLALLKEKPLSVFSMPLWWLRGRAFLKRQIVRHIDPLDVKCLPFNPELLDFLRKEHQKGRSLVLATASDISVAQSVAGHVGIFSAVLASDGQTNLRGRAKVRALIEKFGDRGFDYAGNSSIDLAVWKKSRMGLVTNARPSLSRRAAKTGAIVRAFDEKRGVFRGFLKVLRLSEWVRNMAAFAPLLVTPSGTQWVGFLHAALAFVTLCLGASATSVFIDLTNLNLDRLKPQQENFPFASGILSLSSGLGIALLLLLVCLCLAAFLPWRFSGIFAIYLAVAGASSRRRESQELPLLISGVLYFLRLAAGQEATGLPWSAWIFRRS